MTDHPNHLVALSFVRYDRTPADKRRVMPIFSVGAFIVERINDEEARFTVDHMAFARDASRDLPTACVGALLRGDSHVIGCAPQRQTKPKHPRRSLDLYLPGITGIKRGHRRLILASERSLAAITADFDVPFDGENVSTIQKARSAAHRSQAIWLTYAAFHCDTSTKLSLFSAYRAWRAIENARAIPF